MGDGGVSCGDRLVTGAAGGEGGAADEDEDEENQDDGATGCGEGTAREMRTVVCWWVDRGSSHTRHSGAVCKIKMFCILFVRSGMGRIL